MKIELNKAELAGALVALGKLVSRTSPVEAYKSIEVTGRDGTLRLRTCSLDEAIEYSIDIAEGEYFSCILNFEEFRTVVRSCRTKTLTLEWSAGYFLLDGKILATSETEYPPRLEVSSDSAKVEVLPENFVALLNTAAPIVDRHDSRKILQGINLSKSGIAVTNGKELLNIPMELEAESLTIPFPIALLATKATGDGCLCYWTDGSNVFFRITIGSWAWSGKAMQGVYPNWKQVIPAEKDLNNVCFLTPESLAAFKDWLLSVPDDARDNAVTLTKGCNDTSLKVVCNGIGHEVAVTFEADWQDFKVSINKLIVLRMLSEGHTRLAFSSSHAPFAASGGIGKFVAMPLYIRDEEEKKEEPKPDQINQTTNKEEKMIESNTTTVSAPVQTAATTINREPIAEAT